MIIKQPAHRGDDDDSALSAGPADSARTVVVCDDQQDLRRTLTLLLNNFPQFRIVGEAADGIVGLQKLAETRPVILITDVSMPSGGAGFVRRARAQQPDLHIVMFSGQDDVDVQDEMLAAGANVYVVKTGRLKPLIDAMSAIAVGHASSALPDEGRGRWS